MCTIAPTSKNSAVYTNNVSALLGLYVLHSIAPCLAFHSVSDVNVEGSVESFVAVPLSGVVPVALPQLGPMWSTPVPLPSQLSTSLLAVRTCTSECASKYFVRLLETLNGRRQTHPVRPQMQRDFHKRSSTLYTLCGLRQTNCSIQPSLRARDCPVRAGREILRKPHPVRPRRWHAVVVGNAAPLSHGRRDYLSQLKSSLLEDSGCSDSRASAEDPHLHSDKIRLLTSPVLWKHSLKQS